MTKADVVDALHATRRLRTGGGVLHLGSHPDDEDAGLIAYLTHRHAVRTVYWSATRGEGGQNRLGAERDEALGIVRTWEALEARSIDGGEVRFGPFYDFGYCRTGDQALERWGRTEVVTEVVRAIRDVQPQVVVSRWSGGERDGHGQHRAIGLVLREALAAASDPDRFPELPSPPWRPSKLYTCLDGDWQPGEDRLPPPDDDGDLLHLELGGYDPSTNRTYHELGCLAHNEHRSQAMAFLPDRGSHRASYRLVWSSVPTPSPERDLFDGLDPTLAGLADQVNDGADRQRLEAARDLIDEAIAVLRPDTPERAVGPLLAARAILEDLRGSVGRRTGGSAALARFLARRLRELDAVAARCAGVSVECLLDRRRVAPGGTVVATGRVWNLGPLPISVELAELRIPAGWVAEEVATDGDGGALLCRDHRVSVPPDAELSCPYWLRRARSSDRYDWEPVAHLGEPLDPSPVSLACTVVVAGHRLRVTAPGRHREPFVGGVREQVLSVLPPVALRPRTQHELIPTGSEPVELVLDLELRRLGDPTDAGRIHVQVPPSWTARPSTVDAVFDGGADVRTARIIVQAPGGRQADVEEVACTVEVDGARYDVGVAPVLRPAPGLPGPPDDATSLEEVPVLVPAAVAVHVVDVEFVTRLRYAVVRGVEDPVPDALRHCGLDLTELTDEDLAYAELDVFDTILVGPNAYVARPAVARAAPRLLEHTRRGGTLVVQYQPYPYQQLGAAPYPFRYRQPHDRVTSPTAEVSILRPDHPIITTPNAISAEDFDGWVHDRARYLFGEWDERYTPVLASGDPGEEPSRGGLLAASYGRGTYVYVGFTLHRQVAAGVPGAVRLLANLLGLAEARIRERMRRARTIPLLQGLESERLHDVARAMAEEHVPDGRYLTRQGDRDDTLFLLTVGEVDVIRERPAGDEVLHVARPGEVLGELAVLADIPRAASLRARGDVEALTMRGRDLRRLLEQHPDMAARVIQVLVSRLAGQEADT